MSDSEWRSLGDVLKDVINNMALAYAERADAEQQKPIVNPVQKCHDE